jgi:hypothetical protein
MEVEVMDGLSAIVAAVDDTAIASGRDAQLRGEASSDDLEVSE